MTDLDEIHVRALDGTWEVLGVDRASGIVPEGIMAATNPWGPDTLNLTLKRNDEAQWPDIAAFTPIEYRRAGTLLFGGRVIETPSGGDDAPEFHVQAQGKQYNLDDDVVRRVFVHTRMDEWVDQRTLPLANLAQWISLGDVTSDGRMVKVGLPQATLPVNTLVGIALDLGPENRATYVAFDLESSNNAPAISIECRGTDDGNVAGGAVIFTTPNNVGTTSVITLAAAVTTPRRWIHLYLYWPGGGALGAEVFVRINGIRVFTSDTYRSGHTSILKASDVIKAVRPRAPLIDADETLIDASTFSIPDLGQPFTFQTVREVMTQAAAFEDRLLYVDPAGRIVYTPRPTVASLEVADGVSFEEAAANAGEAIYSRVVVQATGPDGKPLEVIREAAALGGVYTYDLRSAVQPVNGGFETAGGPPATGWAVGTASTITRDTAVKIEGAASGRVTAGTLGAVNVSQTVTGLEPLKLYLPRWSLIRTASWAPGSSPYLFGFFGLGGNGALQSVFPDDLTTTAWSRWQTSAPIAADHDGTMRLTMQGSNLASATLDPFYIDDIALYVPSATLPDRQGFQRTKIITTGLNLTTAAAEVIADLFLTRHSTTPFRGTLKVVGEGVRDVLTGRPVQPHELAIRVGDRIRFPNRTDPDTGQLGREGTITNVTYDAEANAATVTIDNTRSNLEALLARLGAVTEQVR